MSEVMNCPQCGGQIQISAEVRGRTVRCPHCRAELTAPAAPGAAPAGAAPMQMSPAQPYPAPSGGKNVVLVVLSVIGVIVLVGILLAAILLPALMKAQEAARRSACLNNTMQIGLGMVQYAGDHDDFYPPIPPRGTAYDCELIPEGAGMLPPAGLNASRAFLVLMNKGYITSPQVFVCPTSKDRVNEGFPSNYREIDYDALEAFFTVGAGTASGNCSYGWDPTKKHSADATCAIIADKPRAFAGPEGTAANNSENHRGDGQNVFYNDGHTKWGMTPRPDYGDDPDIYTGAPGYETSNTDAKIIR